MKEEEVIEEFKDLIETNVFLKGQKKKKFSQIFEDIFENTHIRKHFLEFAEWEQEYDNLSIDGIVEKYKDELMIRHELRYQLAETPIWKIKDEEKRKFWKYLVLIQSFLSQSARTEPQHSVRLQSRIFPGEEHKMSQLSEVNGSLRKKANYFLEELATETTSVPLVSELVSSGEDQETEFKQFWERNPETVLKEICALANKEGGYLVIGVRDDEEVVGISEDLDKAGSKDKLRMSIDNRINSVIDNKFASEFIDVEFVDYDGHEVILISVQKVFYEFLRMNDVVYLRSGQSKRKIEDEEKIEELRNLRRRRL